MSASEAQLTAPSEPIDGPETRPSARSTDVDACRALLLAILETAIRDQRYLSSVRGRREPSDAEVRRIRAITENNEPVDFFSTSWFVDICYLLGLDPGAVREVALAQEPETLAEVS